MKLLTRLASFVSKNSLKHIKAMGKDCAVNGPNERNCDFSLFSTQEMMQAWSQGKAEGETICEAIKRR